MADLLNLLCDRCGLHGLGTATALVDDASLVDDPATHTGALCPECAAADDPHHVKGSWVLTWG